MFRKVRLSPAFVLLLCLLIWLDNGGFTPPFLLACTLHEAGHLSMMRLCGVRLLDCRIGLTGAVLRAEVPTAASELLCTLMGPLVNASLLFFGRFWLQFGLANAVLLLYNLLPLYPLDGGRLLRLGLTHWFRPETAFRIERIVSVLTVCALVAAGIFAAVFLRLGLSPLLLSAVFLLKLPSLTCQSLPWMLQ